MNKIHIIIGSIEIGGGLLVLGLVLIGIIYHVFDSTSNPNSAIEAILLSLIGAGIMLFIGRMILKKGLADIPQRESTKE